jgi:hypothetical protein
MAIKRAVKSKKQPIKRLVRKRVGGTDPETIKYVADTYGKRVNEDEGSPLTAKSDEAVMEEVNSDFAASGETMPSDEYRLPVDHKKAIDDLLKSGNKFMNEAEYQSFKNMTDEERFTFVDEWEDRRKKRLAEQKKLVEGL